MAAFSAASNIHWLGAQEGYQSFELLFFFFFIFTSYSRVAQRMDFLSLRALAGNSRSVNMVAVFGSGGRSVWPKDCTHTLG